MNVVIDPGETKTFKLKLPSRAFIRSTARTCSALHQESRDTWSCATTPQALRGCCSRTRRGATVACDNAGSAVPSVPARPPARCAAARASSSAPAAPPAGA